MLLSVAILTRNLILQLDVSSLRVTMSRKQQNTFMCFICGGYSEKGPDLCSINFHQYGELELNEKRNGYKGFFQQRAAHASCLDPLLSGSEENPNRCAVCHKTIRSMLRRSTKLAVYRYRKRGCSHVISLHDSCLKGIKAKDFPLMKLL